MAPRKKTTTKTAAAKKARSAQGGASVTESATASAKDTKQETKRARSAKATAKASSVTDAPSVKGASPVTKMPPETALETAPDTTTPPATQSTTRDASQKAAWPPKKVSVVHSQLSYPKLAAAVVVFVVVVAGVTLGAMNLANGYWPWASEETRQAAEVERTVAAVGKHILLPEGETPLVATITDADTLRQEQPFYQNAIDGDQLLIYGESLRAIIYSPSRDIIVNVGPVELPPEQPADTGVPIDPVFLPEAGGDARAETNADTPEESPADESTVSEPQS